MANMRNLTLFLMVVACQAQEYYLSNKYSSTLKSSVTCPMLYRAITDVKVCRTVANLLGIEFKEINQYPVLDPFPVYCTIKNNLISYYENEEYILVDPDASTLCMSDSQTCTNTDGSVATANPCICGTDMCAPDEFCNAANNMCEVAKGFVETELFAKKCPTGYMPITDARGCAKAAQSMVGKEWGAVYGSTEAFYGCASWRNSVVNYYVNSQGYGYNYNTNIAGICIDENKNCSTTDGSGASDDYPCVCGTEICGDNELCYASSSRCEILKGIVETERMTPSCPTGYVGLVDEFECKAVALNLTGKTWMQFKSYSGVAYGCGTWNFDTINFFDYAGGGNPGLKVTNTENALLCRDATMTIDIPVHTHGPIPA